MRPGDIVTIYLDPVTEQRPEGDAELVKQRELESGVFNYGPHTSTLEYWSVRFVDDQDKAVYDRFIKKHLERGVKT